ncbi:hypothetical protein, partial [Streptomyces sp. NPDC002346]
MRAIARRMIVLVLGVRGRLKTTRRGAVPDVAGPERAGTLAGFLVDLGAGPVIAEAADRLPRGIFS